MARMRQNSLRLFTAALFFVAFLVSPAFGAPAALLTDISRTSVDVHTTPQKLKSNTPRFKVTVHRVDELISDSTGDIVAKKLSVFEVSFDVAYNGGNSLLLNGVPIDAGVDHALVQLNAAMAVDSRQIGELEDASGTTIHTAGDLRKAANAAFDIGVATVAVHVAVTTADISFSPDKPPVSVRRFALSETVIEVNGHSVTQTEVGEQIYFVTPDGSFVGVTGETKWASVSQGNSASSVAAGVSDTAPEAAAHASLKSAVVDNDCGRPSLPTRVRSWFGNLAPASRVATSSMLAVGLGVIFAAAVAWTRLVRSSSRVDDESGGGRGDIEKAGLAAKSHSYYVVPVSDGHCVPLLPSYETLACESKSGGDGDEAPMTLQEKRPGEGETEKDSLCQ